MTETTRRVLILCTGNSCRSQMAEGLWQDLGKGGWNARSAGSRPAGYVHPLAVRAMREIGIDIGSHRSKAVDEVATKRFDLVITVCDGARTSCPTLPGVEEALHWPFDDPADASGTDEVKLEEFRRVRDEIRKRIREFLAAQGG